jgi:RAB protein geranylgeranyltransferase component A
MNEKYDVVVCGTGLYECMLSGLLSQESTVTAMQRNASCTSIATAFMAARVLLSI